MTETCQTCGKPTNSPNFAYHICIMPKLPRQRIEALTADLAAMTERAANLAEAKRKLQEREEELTYEIENLRGVVNALQSVSLNK